MTSPALSLIANSTTTPPFALIGSPTREIGTIIPDIVTREVHSDETAITTHPVETGTPVSDHAYIQPPRVEMDCRFSNCTAQAEDYVQTVYKEFLALQVELTPFNVTTGKRQYTSMLIEEMQVTTDEFTEWVLAINVTLKNVIITSDSGGTSSPIQNSSSAQQADPSQTAFASGVSTQQLDSSTGAVPSFAQTSTINYNAVSPYGALAPGG